jgi:predicted  nucleic acid-binding Zn-ribbon protein
LLFYQLKVLYEMIRMGDDTRLKQLETEKFELGERMKALQAEASKLSGERFEIEKKQRVTQNEIQNQILQGILLPGQQNDQTDRVCMIL